MRTRSYALLSLLLTIVLIAVLIPSLLAPARYDDVLLLLNLGIAEIVLGSWILTLCSLLYHFLRKGFLPGCKTYRVLIGILFFCNLLAAIISMAFEGVWQGSAAKLLITGLLPAYFILFLIFSIILRKRGKGS